MIGQTNTAKNSILLKNRGIPEDFETSGNNKSQILKKRHADYYIKSRILASFIKKIMVKIAFIVLKINYIIAMKGLIWIL
ncbi:MAG: hypothetical protein FVQ82_03485 [Planctomycetes bacterium]|nr:hypothetical protein [Planctomycetota bacterium]